MIDSFHGKYSFLSNFYSCKIVYRGKIYPSSEHLFQALKTTDKIQREMIRQAKTPGQAKHKGKYCKLRDNYNKKKDNIMKLVIFLKFKQNKILMDKLIETGDVELVEGNYWHDLYWGRCNCVSCGGIGKNALGNILMELRDKVKDK